ncbi:hypothetical protein FB563_6241 [Streptomyces puniciscabiei]|uniref:Uncharacterized protein n=1 Tax=Streptomyces puniciscabiei TaxID=164348 RepID=A0A542TH43_9ACTN|nr:hypothetical protein [Streptomyces puniciscabiei]TQK86146.1 hypothetical protein FB563_6241 [Streptomyces puniciscabiei]
MALVAAVLLSTGAGLDELRDGPVGRPVGLYVIRPLAVPSAAEVVHRRSGLSLPHA